MIIDSFRKQRLLILYLSLIASILLLLLRNFFLPHSFNFTLLYSFLSISLKHNIFTDSTVYFLLLSLFSIILSLFSIHHFLKFFERYQYKAMVPLLINIFTLISLWGAHYPILFHDFYSHFREREAVVAMIKSGELQPNESQKIKLDNHILYNIYQMQLPPQYAYLSRGEKSGEINLVTDKDNNAKILVFFTKRGRFKGEPNYTALMYKLDKNISISHHIFGVGNLTYYVWLLDSVKINENWFWVDVIED
jgi:hypothetical protein